MKKIYIIPALHIVQVQAVSMIAESLGIGDDEGDGTVLSKGRGSWDEVWDDEE